MGKALIVIAFLSFGAMCHLTGKEGGEIWSTIAFFYAILASSDCECENSK